MNRYGFTLIELLVVIGIIGSLVAVVLPNYIGSRQRGRDSARKSHLAAIQKAMELYRQDQTPPTFPDTLPAVGSPWTSPTGIIYINSFPGDPSNNTAYYYSRPDALTYTLAACLENAADSRGAACPGGFTCSTGKCYIIDEQ